MATPRKNRSRTIAEEMLAGLQAFARDLQQQPAEELKAKYRHRTVTVDFQPRTYDADDVKQLRRSMDCSQKVFADFIGVSLGTLRNWEQGVRRVSGIAARLFDEMRINPGYWKIRLRQSLKERKAG
jgi:putative transcriptional regulator